MAKEYQVRVQSSLANFWVLLAIAGLGLDEFFVHCLAAGGTWTTSANDEEVALVLLGGRVRLIGAQVNSA